MKRLTEPKGFVNGIACQELIDALRVCADDDIICPACERYETMGNVGGTAKCHEDLMLKAAEELERLEAERDDAVRNSYTAQQIEEIQDEAYDLGVESALHHHFGLSWDDAKELREQIAAIQDRNRWIPVTQRLPEPETEVLILAKRGNNAIVTNGMYEDGTKNTEDSEWWWHDHDFKYDEELDAYLIPEGWWEYKHYNGDDEYNHAIDDVVTHWMPLPSAEGLQ